MKCLTHTRAHSLDRFDVQLLYRVCIMPRSPLSADNCACEKKYIYICVFFLSKYVTAPHTTA